MILQVVYRNDTGMVVEILQYSVTGIFIQFV